MNGAQIEALVLPIVLDGRRNNIAGNDTAKAIAEAITAWNTRLAAGGEGKPTREQLDAWLTEHCGKGLPHGEVTDEAGAMHALAYILRRIESTNSYKVHIGQCVSAVSGLQFVLDHFARRSLSNDRGIPEAGS